MPSRSQEAAKKTKSGVWCVGFYSHKQTNKHNCKKGKKKEPGATAAHHPLSPVMRFGLKTKERKKEIKERFHR